MRKKLALLPQEVVDEMRSAMGEERISAADITKAFSYRISVPTISAILNRNVGCSDERLSEMRNAISTIKKANQAYVKKLELEKAKRAV